MIKPRAIVVPIRPPPQVNPVAEAFLTALARMVSDAVVHDLRDRDNDLRPEAPPGTARSAETVRPVVATRQAEVTRLFIQPRRRRLA